jgi:hypothetical protein
MLRLPIVPGDVAHLARMFETDPRPSPARLQDKVEEYADEVFELLNSGAYLYFCGAISASVWRTPWVSPVAPLSGEGSRMQRESSHATI